MSKAINAPALVYCNCTKEKTAKNADEANFEIYRYLTVDPEGNRNIFCTDQPFLFADDCKPSINIKSFPFCRSKNYGPAVKSLKEYADNKCMEVINQEGSEAELLMWGETQVVLQNAYTQFIEQERLVEKSYPCILQVVDRWFNTSQETINNYFNWSQETKEHLDKINETFLQVVRKAKQKLKKAQPGIWERLTDALAQLQPRFEEITIFPSYGSFNFGSYKGFQRFDKKWNDKQSLSWFDDRMKEMQKILELYSAMVCDELFFAENQEYVNSGLGEVKDLFLEFYEAMTELDYEDDTGFSEALENFNGNLNELKPDDQFVDEGKTFLTINSFLVCRCGGIINIVYDGQGLKAGLSKVESNVIDLLKWIEKDLHETIYGTQLWDCWPMGVSFIDGFNFVRYILLAIGQASQYDDYIRAVYNEEEMDGYGVEMDISIQSRSTLNKDQHNKSGGLNLASGVLGALGIKCGDFFSITASTVMLWLDNSTDNRRSLETVFAALIPQKIISNLAKIGGVFYMLKAFTGAMVDYSYESTADYVGEIQVTLKVGTHDITYIRGYDIIGTAMGDKPDRDMSMHMKPFYRLDVSRTAYVSGEELDLRTYDNTIKVNTTLAVDADKVEKIKREYTVNEGGINEK